MDHPLQSSLSLFDNGSHHVPPKYLNSSNFKRSPSTNSNLSLAANFKMPSVGLGNIVFKRSSMTSLRSPAAETPPEVSSSEQQEVRSLRTFSPEPVSVASATVRIPPVISENEAFQGGNLIDILSSGVMFWAHFLDFFVPVMMHFHF